MNLRVSAAMPPLAGITDEVLSEVAADATDSMRGATTTLKTILRGQVTGAGLGVRLGNTWRASTYPSNGNALNPAGYAWSNAPDIIDAFDRGATIRPHGDHNYLWIPTDAVPRAPGRGTTRLTPEQVLQMFQADDFVIRKGKAGRLEAFIVEQRATTKRGTRRRPRRGRLAHGPTGELVLMFNLARSVTLPKALDLNGAGQAGADDFVSRFTRVRSR